jgi:hypothetical protein
MNSGIFGKDSRIDDKAKRDAVPGVMAQRAPRSPARRCGPPHQRSARTGRRAAIADHFGSTLTVGPNIKLKSAEISDCDTLVVEGHVDGTVSSQAIRSRRPAR